MSDSRPSAAEKKGRSGARRRADSAIGAPKASSDAAKRYPVSEERGPNGRRVCRYCHVNEVPPGRRTLCSDHCRNEMMLRCDRGWARREVQKRDRGVCALCKCDTQALLRQWNRLKRPRRNDELTEGERLARRRKYEASLEARGFDLHKALWEADHIVPVARGGNEMGLENLRTLCVPCHKKVTASFAAWRARNRRRRTGD